VLSQPRLELGRAAQRIDAEEKWVAEDKLHAIRLEFTYPAQSH
jgi:hypothetical protein